MEPLKPKPFLAPAIEKHIGDVINARYAHIDRLCGEAIMLQAQSMIGRLVIVTTYDGMYDGVASMLVCPMCHHDFNEHEGYCGRTIDGPPTGCRECISRWTSLQSRSIVPE